MSSFLLESPLNLTEVHFGVQYSHLPTAQQQHLHGCSALIPQQGTKQGTQLSCCEETQNLELPGLSLGDLEEKNAGIHLVFRRISGSCNGSFFL
jgi:hypothetical protein